MVCANELPLAEAAVCCSAQQLWECQPASSSALGQTDTTTTAVWVGRHIMIWACLDGLCWLQMGHWTGHQSCIVV